jgi:hypothetical protein
MGKYRAVGDRGADRDLRPSLSAGRPVARCRFSFNSPIGTACTATTVISTRKGVVAFAESGGEAPNRSCDPRPPALDLVKGGDIGANNGAARWWGSTRWGH